MLGNKVRGPASDVFVYGIATHPVRLPYAWLRQTPSRNHGIVFLITSKFKKQALVSAKTGGHWRV
jgi:hypothetical protein